MVPTWDKNSTPVCDFRHTGKWEGMGGGSNQAGHRKAPSDWRAFRVMQGTASGAACWDV